jgi:phosphatidylinositol-bisphosphatase
LHEGHPPELSGDAEAERRNITEAGRMQVMFINWNMHAKDPPDDLSALLPRNRYHMYIVGTEEAGGRSIAASAVFTSKSKWEAQLVQTLGPEYQMLRSQTLQAIHIALFAHKSVIPMVSDMESGVVASGLRLVPTVKKGARGNDPQLGNKGGAGIALVMGGKSYFFVNCHFTAHQHKIEERNADYAKINAQLFCNFPKARANGGDGRTTQVKENDCTAKFDYVFWMGDFNYRINGSRRLIDRMIERRLHKALLCNDQLRIEQRKKKVFEGLVEGPLLFAPTYKYDRESDLYDTSEKQRIPSWTDRVLYKPATGVRLFSYRAVSSIRTSDHRPVTASFELPLHPTDGSAEADGTERSWDGNLGDAASAVCIIH